MEVTVTSIQSVTHHTIPAEQPSHLSRWWMRHYRHIGLASMAGSAILVCVSAIILLPLIVHHSSKGLSPISKTLEEFCAILENEECASADDSSIAPTMENIMSPIVSTTVTDDHTVTTTVPIGSLCAENATWKKEAVTIVSPSVGVNSILRVGLQNPRDILIDTNGNLFIADCGNSRVIYWPVNATEGCMVAGTGAFSSWINSFKCPASIIDWEDQLYVSDIDNYRILAFPLSRTAGSPDGITIIGRYGAGSALNQINYVSSMAVDRTRQLFYLSDSQNSRILQLNLTDNTLQLVAETGTVASNNISLNGPLGIAVAESNGSLYVTDSRNHRIQKFDLNSMHASTIAGGMTSGQNLSQLYLPSGVAIDLAGNTYIADTGNHRIVQWLVDAQQGRLIAGTGIAGADNTQLNSPVQLKFDIHHNLYVVDQMNNRIQRFDLQSNGC